MAHKPPPLLHELLEEEQEPFHLKTYITNKRSQHKTHTTLQIRKQRRPIVHENPTNNLCKHACFFSFHASPDVRRSPFSPAKSPCKSPTVFLHIPSRTATILVEAAMRIQKHHHSKPRTGFALLGSFLKRLKDRTKNRKRAMGGDSDIIKIPDQRECPSQDQDQAEDKAEERVGMSCSCSNRRLSSADWTENNEDKPLSDFEASTSSRVSDFSEEMINGADDFESYFCSSPFRFSLHQSPSSTGHRTPEFSSPAASPSRRVKQEKENPDNVQVEEEEEKEQCSPVSVLDPPFDEDDERGNCDAEEEEVDDEDEGDDDGDYDMECSFENVQRAKQQLLYRLRRFEKLADLDPIELERKLLEGSDDEGHAEREDSEGDEPLMSRVLDQSSPKYDSRSMKRLVSDLIVEEKRELISSCGSEVVMGRICNRLDSWKEVEFDTIDMMIGLDFKKEFEGWAKFGHQVQETAAEIEVAICMVLIHELTEELVMV